jgi:hypothetical protein
MTFGTCDFVECEVNVARKEVASPFDRLVPKTALLVRLVYRATSRFSLYFNSLRSVHVASFKTHPTSPIFLFKWSASQLKNNSKYPLYFLSS